MERSSKILVLALALIVVGWAQVSESQPAGDQITSLPFFNGTLWPQWSGYATVNASHGRALHYWFVQSQNDPENDPVVLWLNGGPGCSSLDGFLYENGPYSWAGNGDELLLNDNPYAWNKVANMIYLESPVGVGFSYSNTSEDYLHPSDWQTAEDNHNFLLWFFENFPQYADNEFWIAGESYAGTYIPTLAKTIIEYTNNTINFQGIFVGNGITDAVYDGPFVSVLPFEYGHGLIGPLTWQQIQNECYPDNNTVACNNLVNQSYAVFNNIDIYNIIGDCFSQRPLLLKGYEAELFGMARDGSSSSGSGSDNIVPCTNSVNAYAWLNNAEVKEAIHVRQDLTWEICSDSVFYNYDSNAGSMLTIYPELIKANLQILIYSGDVDGRVPFTGTAAWVDSLQQPLQDYWVQWYFNDDEGLQTGGFKTVYEGIQFITIRGAGHMVPQFAPAAALTFFSKFLQGIDI